MGLLVQIALAEAAGGAAAGIVADSVLYAIDSAKVRSQADASTRSPLKSFKDAGILFRGMAPTILLGSVPVFGTFFVLYAPLRESITMWQKEQQQKVPQQQIQPPTDVDTTSTLTYGWIGDLLLPMAALVCAIPATIVGVPSDVIKKRLVLGIDQNAWTAVRNVVQQKGIRQGLFAGWHVNLIRDLPFAGIKIGLYESFVKLYQRHVEGRAFMDTNDNVKISATGAAICGIASGVSCAILTCPLDVVNTRIKASSTATSISSGGMENNSRSIAFVTRQILREEGVAALFRGVVMRSFVLGIGSSIFWPIQHSVAQQLQPYDTCPIHSRFDRRKPRDRIEEI